MSTRKTYHNNFFFLFVSLLFLFNSTIFPQSDIKKGFKFGIELKNSLTEKTGSFNKTFGFAFGVFTGIHIYSYKGNAFLLKTELNFIMLQHYNPGQVYFNWADSNYAVIDEKYTFGIIEFALLPTYHRNIDKNISFDIFLGPSIGVGKKGIDTKKQNSNKLNYDPYDEYTMGFVQPISFNFGISFYYKPMVLDVRYKYDYLNGFSKFNDLTNLYLQIGIAL